MKDYLIKYSTYFLILGIVIIVFRLLGFESRRLDSLPIWLQYTTGGVFLLVGFFGKKLKSNPA